MREIDTAGHYRGVGHTGCVTIRERQWPSKGAAAMALVIPVMVAIAYGAVFGPLIGVAVAVAGTAIAGAVMWRTSPVIAWQDDVLRVDRAELPGPAIASVTALDRATAEQLLREDGRFFTAIRRGSPHVLRIDIADPQDPHIGWLVSIRDRDAFTLAINGK